jgi:hypothetical protein
MSVLSSRYSTATLTFSIALITTEIVTLLTQACLMIIAEEQVETMPF